MAAITIYDGAESIGGNKIYVEDNQRGVFLDFGMNYARRSAFFVDFLNERAVRGIHDMLYLDIIPRINVYRQDLLTSDVEPLIKSYPKVSPEAVLLSHAHTDHNGNIGLLDHGIPVVASATSIAIMKAMRDIKSSGLGGDIAYSTLREKDKNNSNLLKTEGSKYQGRQFCYAGKCNPELSEFISDKPGSGGRNAKKLDGCGLEALGKKELPFEIKPFEVNHSIYGAMAYTLRSNNTSLAYTGDFRIGDNAKQLPDFIKEAKNSSVLIIEGTRTGRSGDMDVTETNVYDTCKATSDDVKGIIIADFSARNFERLEIFKRIAREIGRQLVITAKDAYYLYAIGCAAGTCSTDGLLVYDELKDKKACKYETETLAQDCPVEYVRNHEIKDNPDGYILCMSFYDIKQLLDIEPRGGAYIYSSSEAYSEEQEIDFEKLKNWLELFSIEPHGFTFDNGKPKFIKGFHASGHATGEELERVIDAVDPDVLIPVHTQNNGWFKEKWEQTRLVKNGETIEI
ncbi:conserved hypothetical protein [Methanocella paludicola SANAE]|uniref:Uncharacterized protein n=1 Tax=Methanocella paludicola (strain DSM 17711 / JCM 13418 / NBRC 101707 / SANAE) TaxID=304371 RepID=D1YYY6_METPS|nr:MBL fold metallo-hydrolase [Methanocella paludicola]BAI61658.1 conserved hypothetical protein [Methanocella paludicola SANAE]